MCSRILRTVKKMTPARPLALFFYVVNIDRSATTRPLQTHLLPLLLSPTVFYFHPSLKLPSSNLSSPTSSALLSNVLMDPNQENIPPQDGLMDCAVANVHNGAIDAMAAQIDGSANNA